MKFRNLFILISMLCITQQSFAQEITMFPGFWKVKYYEDDREVSRSDVESLMESDQKANALWQKSKKHTTVSSIAFGAEVGFLIWQLVRSNNNQSITAPFVGVIGSTGVAIGFAISSTNLKKEAILRYNQSKDLGSLSLGPTRNGFGFVYSF